MYVGVQVRCASKFCGVLFVWDENTVYTVYLADIKYGELVCDVYWWVFNLATRAVQITYGYGQV